MSVARSILEARLHNGPKVAELAARRRPAGLVTLLDESIRDLENDDDPVGQQRHALKFWDHVVDGADSIAFRLMFNTLRAAYEPALPALATMMAAEVGQIEAYRAVAGQSCGRSGGGPDSCPTATRTRHRRVDHRAQRHRASGAIEQAGPSSKSSNKQ